MYRTTDGGRTWTRVLPADGSSGASDVYLDYARSADRLCVAAAAAVRRRRAPASSNRPTAARRGSRSAAAACPMARASPRSRCRRARTAGGCTRSSAACAAARRGRRRRARALSIRRRRRHVDARHAAARERRRQDLRGSAESRRRVSDGHGDLSIDRRRPARRRRSGARRAAPTRASSGSIRRTRSGCSPASIRARRSRSTAARSWTPYYGLVNGQFYRVATDYDFPYHVCGPQQDSGTACVREPQRLRRDPAERLVSGRRIRERLSDRRSARQALHVHAGLVSRAAPLRSHDRPGRRALSADGRRSLRRRAAARVLAAGSAHALHGGAVRARVDRSAARRGARSARISPRPPSGAPPPDPRRRRQRASRAPAPGGSIQSLAPSPVAAGVIWVGTSTGLDPGDARRRQDVDERHAAEHCRRAASTSSTRRTRTPGTAYAALLSRDAIRTSIERATYGGAGRRSRPASPTAAPCASCARIRSIRTCSTPAP